MERLRVGQMIDRASLGGGQTALALLAENLDPELFEVTVFSAGGGPLVEEVRGRGLTHVAVPLSKTLSVGTVGRVAAALKENRIQILHTHGGIAGFYGRWGARRSGTAVVVHTLHGIHYLHYRNPLLRRLHILQERILCRSTDALILVCQADLGLARKHSLCPVEKMFVIPNGLDLKPVGSAEKRREMRLKLGWDPEQPVIGTVARLHRQKGVVYLIRAAEKVLASLPGARIVVVGEGPLGRKLRHLAERMSLGDRLVFLGERRDAVELISVFDVFVLPSLWEGLPFVLVEAAALEKPIVATAVDGITEIIEDGKTGRLVPPGNAGELADAIIRLLQNREGAFRLAERARALVPARFPLRRMVEQTQNLYLELYRRKAA
jgi:glycosyltransferase involved in cell wall biosynthesis